MALSLPWTQVQGIKSPRIGTEPKKKKKKHSTNVKYNNNNFLEAQRCQVESQVHWVGQNRTGFCREPPWLTCTPLLNLVSKGSVRGPGEVFLPRVLLPLFQPEAAQRGAGSVPALSSSCWPGAGTRLSCQHLCPDFLLPSPRLTPAVTDSHFHAAPTHSETFTTMHGSPSVLCLPGPSRHSKVTLRFTPMQRHVGGHVGMRMGEGLSPLWEMAAQWETGQSGGLRSLATIPVTCEHREHQALQEQLGPRDTALAAPEPTEGSSSPRSAALGSSCNQSSAWGRHHSARLNYPSLGLGTASSPAPSAAPDPLLPAQE